MHQIKTILSSIVTWYHISYDIIYHDIIYLSPKEILIKHTSTKHKYVIAVDYLDISKIYGVIIYIASIDLYIHPLKLPSPSEIARSIHALDNSPTLQETVPPHRNFSSIHKNVHPSEISYTYTILISLYTFFGPLKFLIPLPSYTIHTL